jgi:hypothetical protein
VTEKEMNYKQIIRQRQTEQAGRTEEWDRDVKGTGKIRLCKRKGITSGIQARWTAEQA